MLGQTTVRALVVKCVPGSRDRPEASGLFRQSAGELRHRVHRAKHLPGSVISVSSLRVLCDPGLSFSVIQSGSAHPRKRRAIPKTGLGLRLYFASVFAVRAGASHLGAAARSVSGGQSAAELFRPSQRESDHHDFRASGSARSLCLNGGDTGWRANRDERMLPTPINQHPHDTNQSSVYHSGRRDLRRFRSFTRSGSNFVLGVGAEQFCK